MSLTDQQIQQLFTFCEKKLVRYYDLQAELVDHLAERIEEEMGVNPQLYFDEALQKVYAGFGLFGFAHIVRDKTAALRTHHQRLWVQQAKTFFTIPRVIGILSLFALLYTAGYYLPPAIRTNSILVGWAVGYILELTQLILYRRQEQKKLMLTQFYSAALFLGPAYLYNQVILSRIGYYNNIGFSLLGVIIFIIIATSIELNRKIRRKAIELYPRLLRCNSRNNTQPYWPYHTGYCGTEIDNPVPHTSHYVPPASTSSPAPEGLRVYSNNRSIGKGLLMCPVCTAVSTYCKGLSSRFD